MVPLDGFANINQRLNTSGSGLSHKSGYAFVLNVALCFECGALVRIEDSQMCRRKMMSGIDGKRSRLKELFVSEASPKVSPFFSVGSPSI